MWTNVFRIGGLHNVSWFQFLPSETELNPSSDTSSRAEQNDVATYLVLSSHLRLQKEGFLTTWTNSFVGPWDPSQGLYNPDEKIKLWLFLPGRHSSITDKAQAAVSKLRVVASGIWVAPGDSEEISVAFSQSLRNCIERALTGLSYMRFGDVFSKVSPQSEEYLRRGRLTVEFIFAATEEAVFVHVIVSAKNVRTLSSGDAERLSRSSLKNSSYRLPVIVSPHGMRGSLTGFCPKDLVKQVYFSSGNLRSSSGYIGLPPHAGSGSRLINGDHCYVEVILGCCQNVNDNTSQTNSTFAVNLPYNQCPEPSLGSKDYGKGQSDLLSMCEKKFIYPAEAVLVPILQSAFAKFSLKRFWLQNWIGPSLAGSSLFMHWTGDFDFLGASGNKSDGFYEKNGYNSSGSSRNSSISSTSSASSGSGWRMTSRTGDLDADADSLTCNDDHPKMGSKRPRTGMAESFGQVGTANDQFGWDWDDDDDDDRGVGMDIQALLSEFGDFGDFFENDALPFGEPPGTAASHSLMLPSDSADVGSSPMDMMDVSDQIVLPVGFSSFESFNPVPPIIDEGLIKSQEVLNNSVTSAPSNQMSSSSNSEFDHLMKAEAMMTFAPEYGAVEAPMSEISSTFIKSPYLPKSHKVESSDSRTSNYVYGPTPPASDSDGASDKVLLGSKAYIGNNDGRTLYTKVEGIKNQYDKLPTLISDNNSKKEGVSQLKYSNYNAAKIVQGKKADCISAVVSTLLSSKTLLATDVGSVMFQAFMYRMRHKAISSKHSSPVSLSRLSGNFFLNQVPNEPSSLTDNVSARNEIYKKEVPTRIAGDFDGGILDSHMSAPVGVWRTVSVPKTAKPASSPNIEAGSSLPHSSFSENSLLSYGQRQPLQELLDGIALLVQQATSFVDLALDSDCGDGPYGWLALEELWRRELSCGPSAGHAGCGGTLASCHSLDIAGVKLVDPLSAEVFPSSVITLLQSDIKTALKSAFGQSDGPLYVTDWCKGRNQSMDGVSISEGSTAESVLSEDGGRGEEIAQSQDIYSSELLRPTLFVLPSPSILVGYQDDWLKVSTNSLPHWEKAPFEPYALAKNMNYIVICPDIDPLTSAAADFFQQLGTVYETCRLGTHLPQILGNQMESDGGRLSSSGFVLLDCPQSMKIESNNTSLLGSLSDYFLSLSNGWNVSSYLKSLSKALKGLKLGSCLYTNQKEGSASPCVVVYIVCPFPDPSAVLRTVVESSIALGSGIQPDRDRRSLDRDRRSLVNSQVAKAFGSSAAVDEASISQIPVLSGFSVPKLVLQVVSVDSIFRITSPSFNELVILKDTAFCVYNKARRISRGMPNDAFLSSSLSSRSSSALAPMNSISGIWKDCVGSRMTGSTHPRDGELDGSIRTNSWDSSWQITRSGGLSCDSNRNGDFYINDEIFYLFEPLFILSEPGSVDRGVSPTFGGLGSESSKPIPEDGGRGSGLGVNSMEGITLGSSSQGDASQVEGKAMPSLHCCYGWTEDWRWLVSIWTDARGELLDTHIFPFGGISSRQDTKGLQCLFVQVLQQGCQILQACSSPDNGSFKPRDFVITRIGSFFELEYLEWQKAIYSAGGPEIKKWPIQLRRSAPSGVATSSNGSSLQQHDLSLIQERASSTSTLYGSHSKPSSFVKGGMGQSGGRKQTMSGQTISGTPRGLFQWVHSISFASISLDHSLHFVLPAELVSPGGQSSTSMSATNYIEGFTPVKSLGSTAFSYMMIPSPNMRFLHPSPLQLPTCLTAESPPLAHLLHSKGCAIPLSTGFVVSKAVPSMRKDSRINMKEEWPSVLSVSLIDYYGGYDNAHDKVLQGMMKQGGGTKETRDFEVESHLILESIAAELHALSWMTVSPAYLDRRTALPSHCDVVLRLSRLLHFADKERSRLPDKSGV
ncbi:hypothetical protein Bca101_067870 [Brassica carinata]